MDKIKSLVSQYIPEGSFARNVVTLMTGTTFAQALMILVAPILTRLYSPEDFGVFALYISILGILSVVSCWRYELAIVLPEKDEDAANLLVLSILICFGMAAITLFLVALFRVPLANLLGAPDLAPWLWLLPLSLIAAGLFQAFNYWSTRRKQFKRLAARQITQSSVTVITQVGVGATVHPGPAGLIGGSIIGQLMATGRLAWQIGRDDGNLLRFHINRADAERMLIRYKEFPIYSSWSSILNTTAAMLPLLLLGYFFNPAVVGFYALAQKVLSMPMGVIGNSIAQVFYPRAMEANRTGDLDRLVMRAFRVLISISLVPIILLIIVAPILFNVVFGGQWIIAGEYVQWLSIWFIFTFISSPLSTIFMVKERQNDLMLFNIVLFLSRIIILLRAGSLCDDLLAIKLLGSTGGLIYLALCVWVLILSGIKFNQLIIQIYPLLIRAIPYIMPAIIIALIDIYWATLVVSILSGLVFLLNLTRDLKPKDFGITL